MEIDDAGLDSTDRKLMAAIAQKFGSGPVGVAALAAVLSEEVETIEDVYEPYLLRLGFLDRTPQGRILTEGGRAHLAAARLRGPAATQARAGDAAAVGRRASSSRPRSLRDRRRRRSVRHRSRSSSRAPTGRSTRARLGRLTLAHGVVETPQFMPVGTNATVKALHPDDLARSARSIILANTYHLYLRPGHERIERLGGLHRFMAWDRPILTDSGGFQVVSLGDLRVVDDDGVTFRSHLDGSIHRFTPEHAIEVQEALGVGRRGRLRPAGPARLVDAGRRRRRDRADASLGRALARRPPADPTRRCSGSSRAASSRTCGPTARGSSPRCRSTASASAASPATRRPTSANAALDVAVDALDDDPRPRYLMGLGSPIDLLEAVHRGIDLFDSVLPARVARTGQVWVPDGRLNLRNQRFLDDPEPIQDGCPCLACRRFSRAYIAHLFRAKELLAYRLATCHNLTFTLDFMARIRAALRAGDLPRIAPGTALARGPGERR